MPTEIPVHDGEDLFKYNLMVGMGQRVEEKMKMNSPNVGNY